MMLLASLFWFVSLLEPQISHFDVHADRVTKLFCRAPQVSNLARVFMDISGNQATFLDRADHSDKWSPLAQPGYW